ncbi:hypothetical protein [Dyadobacter arcticus]|uniref:Lipoprotein n=1 Tax=Dyadobacter arcticus TaxID=1078754 RepID=A0ABX0ULA4_9BACT|nr:hypothetical protein [Dyadobacter arcticus]NIJ53791.1 hypothetical protein [Dyadobacter arcticus]
MKTSALFVLSVLLITSCNQVNDLNPVDPNAEPAAAVEVVKGRFPQAQNLVFKTIITSKIWEVAFGSGVDKYTSLVDKTKMWETFRANPDSVPILLNDLLLTSSFKGGTFSENAEDIDFYPFAERRNRLIYTLNGADYSFNWYRYKGENYRPTNVTFDKYKYKIQFSTQENFPQTLREYLTAQSLTFRFGEVRVRLNDEKQYWIQVEFKRSGTDFLGFMLFDDKGKLKWTSREFNQPIPDDQVTNIETLPAVIQQHLDNSPELVGFRYYTSGLDKWRSEFDGLSSYYLRLRNKDYAELCELYFDQDGNLLNQRYFISF